MIKKSIRLQDLRRKIYLKAKSDKTSRFWGLYVHVCKMETLHESYLMAKRNNGAPGIDGVTFKAVEEGGIEDFLKQIRTELVSGTYKPLRNRVDLNFILFSVEPIILIENVSKCSLCYQKRLKSTRLFI